MEKLEIIFVDDTVVYEKEQLYFICHAFDLIRNIVMDVNTGIIDLTYAPSALTSSKFAEILKKVCIYDNRQNILTHFLLVNFNIIFNDVRCFDYAYRNGFVMTDKILRLIMKFGTLECFEYAYSKKCPVPKRMLKYVIESKQDIYYNWLLENHLVCEHEICTYLFEKKHYDNIIRIHDDEHHHTFEEVAQEIILYLDMDCLRYFMATEKHDISDLQRLISLYKYNHIDSEKYQYLMELHEEEQDHKL